MGCTEEGKICKGNIREGLREGKTGSILDWVWWWGGPCEVGSLHEMINFKLEVEAEFSTEAKDVITNQNPLNISFYSYLIN